MLLEVAAGIAVADRQMPGMAFAERPMDGLEACRRSATALPLRMAIVFCNLSQVPSQWLRP